MSRASQGYRQGYSSFDEGSPATRRPCTFASACLIGSDRTCTLATKCRRLVSCRSWRIARPGEPAGPEIGSPGWLHEKWVNQRVPVSTKKRRNLTNYDQKDVDRRRPQQHLMPLTLQLAPHALHEIEPQPEKIHDNQRVLEKPYQRERSEGPQILVQRRQNLDQDKNWNRRYKKALKGVTISYAETIKNSLPKWRRSCTSSGCYFKLTSSPCKAAQTSSARTASAMKFAPKWTRTVRLTAPPTGQKGRLETAGRCRK